MLLEELEPNIPKLPDYSAVRKLTIRVLLQGHTLLRVTSRTTDKFRFRENPHGRILRENKTTSVSMLDPLRTWEFLNAAATKFM